MADPWAPPEGEAWYSGVGRDRSLPETEMRNRMVARDERAWNVIRDGFRSIHANTENTDGTYRKDFQAHDARKAYYDAEMGRLRSFLKTVYGYTDRDVDMMFSEFAAQGARNAHSTNWYRNQGATVPDNYDLWFQPGLGSSVRTNDFNDPYGGGPFEGAGPEVTYRRRSAPVTGNPHGESPLPQGGADPAPVATGGAAYPPPLTPAQIAIRRASEPTSEGTAIAEWMSSPLAGFVLPGLGIANSFYGSGRGLASTLHDLARMAGAPPSWADKSNLPPAATPWARYVADQYEHYNLW